VNNASPLLSLTGLRVQFGGLTAVDNASLDIAPNSVVSLIGPNGAGKTTLFNAISGFVPIASGEIEIHGKQIAWPQTHELSGLRISRTLQGVGLFSGLNACENVMLGADSQKSSNIFTDLIGASGKSEKRLRDKALEVLSSLGVSHLADRLPHELSYPDTKKVALARALISDPLLLMLDEPAAGLDQADIDELATIINEVKRTCAVFVVEHHVDFVGEISDKVYVLNFGKIIAAGTFDEVKADPEVLTAYLGSNRN
jgi:branched-chain amino acid transport system ATP-binding protein